MSPLVTLKKYYVIFYVKLPWKRNIYIRKYRIILVKISFQISFEYKKILIELYSYNHLKDNFILSFGWIMTILFQESKS